MTALDEPSTDLLLWLLTLCVASAFLGAVLEYCAHTIHRARHPRPHRIADWIAHEIHAWHRHHQRTHPHHHHWLP